MNYDEIEVPENASFNDYYVYDNKVVYTYDYFDYIISKMYSNHVEVDEFEPQICIYDMDTKSSEVIYTFDDAMKYTTHGVMINALHGSIFQICMYMILTDMKQFR